MTTTPQKAPRYSIASCVVETAHRLIATSSADPYYKEYRRAGRALISSEVLSFYQLDDMAQKRKGSQGLILELGFYDQSPIDALDALDAIDSDLLIEEIGFSVGGWPSAIDLRKVLISDPKEWLGAQYAWPQNPPISHLDLFTGPLSRQCRVQDLGILQIIARTLRYRLGLDHSSGSSNFFWWTTPQTEAWIGEALGKKNTPMDRHIRRDFNGPVSDLVYGIWQTPYNYDPLYNTPDDWGLVDLETDPISVLTVGPMSNAETHSDVAKTIALAGNQLKVTNKRVAMSDTKAADPIEPYALHLEVLADSEPARRDVDVVVVYRGGISRNTKPLTKPFCERLLNAADRLVSCGVEVVLGIGHGETSVHEVAGRDPKVGIFEAVTPTAAANWVLKEHVNNRLMRLETDPGQ